MSRRKSHGRHTRSWRQSLHRARSIADRDAARALIRHWYIIQIGATTPPSLEEWRIRTKEFREDLEWAVGKTRRRKIPRSRLYLSPVFHALRLPDHQKPRFRQLTLSFRIARASGAMNTPGAKEPERFTLNPLHDSLAAITPQNAFAWFRHCGDALD